MCQLAGGTSRSRRRTRGRSLTRRSTAATPTAAPPITSTTATATAALAIGESGAKNAALLAMRVLSIQDADLAGALESFAAEQAKSALEAPLER